MSFRKEEGAGGCRIEKENVEKSPSNHNSESFAFIFIVKNIVQESS